ncbi:MAG: SDR family oxidoreductase [Nitrospinota bacterium]|nr:SDR family oxidoreductase [Nitrospinota bacterium]
MSFLGLEGKVVVVFGVANKKSVAFHIGKILREEGAVPVYVVRSQARKESTAKFIFDADVYICDVENEKEIDATVEKISTKYPQIYGIIHSIAFANYSDGLKPFHETKKKDFLQSVDISCYSLIRISNAFKDFLEKSGSVVTISISTTRMAAEPYGYMGPVKAALDSTVCFLAKSFSAFSEIRFNAVCAGLLKTSASAGIPGYLDYYLHAEQLTLKKKALATAEVARAAVFLLSRASTGINAQGIVLDAGMSVNYFDKDIVKKTTRLD